ncbi:MAG: DUF3971 domain-containing protein, partial [Planctomycetes bacterium]|nr:DUF3971 domain-containing protein [Planctomycetota bacterium]
AVELRDAHVKVVYRDDAKEHTVEDLLLNVRARPARADSPFYDIVWEGGGAKIARGHSRINLSNGRVENISGGLPWMSLEAVMIAVNARYDTAGAWSDLLGLKGLVRATDYSFSGGADETKTRSATVELDNASLSIPINEYEHTLPPDQRYLRFDQVLGTAVLTASGIEAEFTGLLYGSPCTVWARLQGGIERLRSLDDVAVDVRLKARQLRLPEADPNAPAEQRRFIERWGSVREFYERFDPHGLVDVEIDAEKPAGPQQEFVAHRVLLTARGADASHCSLPYRVRDLRGVLEFTSDHGIFVRDIRGQHDGGSVAVNGWFSGPRRSDSANLRIRGKDLPIDDALTNAVPTKYREVREWLNPQGLLDVDLTLTRKARAGATTRDDWDARTILSFRDISACYRGFPYDLDRVSGEVVLEGDQAELRNVVGWSGEGLVKVAGELTLVDGDARKVQLVVNGENIAFDDKLMSALPESWRGRLAAFHPRGRFDSRTLLRLAPGDAALRCDSDVALSDVSIRPDRFPVTIEGINGQLTLTRDRIVLHEAAGRYGGATATAAGVVDLTVSPQETDVMIRANGLIVDDVLRAAMPAKLQSALARWRVEGPLDADITLQQDIERGGGGLALEATARLDGAAVQHDLFPIPFEAVRGEIVFGRDGARAVGVRARYGQASVLLDFENHETDQAEEGTIKLTAQGVALDHSFRDILPADLRQAWDRLELSGSADLRLDHLGYHHEHGLPDAVWSVEGSARLYEVGLPGLTEIQHVSGTVTGTGMLVDRLGGTTLNGSTDFASLHLRGRQLTNLTGPWSYVQTADGEGRFALDSVQASIYGGSIWVQVDAMFNRARTTYSFAAIVHDMGIGPFLNVDSSPGPGSPEHIELGGNADVRMYVSGEIGDATVRRGSGRVEIVEGEIYRLPIILAILNVLNLSLPEGYAFDDAEADFFLIGDTLELRNILLRGDVLALAGSGAMSLSDRGLDLDLVNVSPHRWARDVPGLAAFVEGASRELVELHVTGSLAQPRVTAVPLRAISDELKQLFQRKKPRKMRAVAP